MTPFGVISPRLVRYYLHMISYHLNTKTYSNDRTSSYSCTSSIDLSWINWLCRAIFDINKHIVLQISRFRELCPSSCKGVNILLVLREYCTEPVVERKFINTSCVYTTLSQVGQYVCQKVAYAITRHVNFRNISLSLCHIHGTQSLGSYSHVLKNCTVIATNWGIILISIVDNAVFQYQE